MDRIRDSGSPYTVGLEFLDDMKNDELEVLVRIIIDKGGFSEELTDDADYQRYHPDHQKYTQRIAYEFVAFGNDTFRVFSDWKYYKDVLCDVCDQMEVHLHCGDARGLSKRRGEEFYLQIIEPK